MSRIFFSLSVVVVGFEWNHFASPPTPRYLLKSLYQSDPLFFRAVGGVSRPWRKNRCRMIINLRQLFIFIPEISSPLIGPSSLQFNENDKMKLIILLWVNRKRGKSGMLTMDSRRRVCTNRHERIFFSPVLMKVLLAHSFIQLHCIVLEISHK